MHPASARVYIIESPKPDEIRRSMCEGRAIAEALNLAGQEQRYWLVVDRAQLIETFREIVLDLGPLDPDHKRIPFFHLSVHGNEEGIALTSGEFIYWSELSDLLWQVGSQTGRVNDRGFALAHVTMSACKGVHGAKMWLPEEKNGPAISLVGPTRDVAWTDSLTAWIVFYHLVLTKNSSPVDALGAMDSATGLNSGFALFAPSRIGVPVEK